MIKNVPLERWIQLMIGSFKTVNLAWMNKISVISYTLLFVYEVLIATNKECMSPRFVNVVLS